jgi:retron-type reverse transcriptase
MGKPAATDRPRLTPLNHSFTLDCDIYVRSERSGQRVMKSITHYITQRLKLKVNETKSAVARLQE